MPAQRQESHLTRAATPVSLDFSYSSSVILTVRQKGKRSAGEAGGETFRACSCERCPFLSPVSCRQLAHDAHSPVASAILGHTRWGKHPVGRLTQSSKQGLGDKPHGLVVRPVIPGTLEADELARTRRTVLPLLPRKSAATPPNPVDHRRHLLKVARTIKPISADVATHISEAGRRLSALLQVARKLHHSPLFERSGSRLRLLDSQ